MNNYESLKLKLKNREKITMGDLMVLNSPLMLPAFSGADCRSMGANIFWLSSDLDCLRSGFNMLVDGVKEPE